jgi:hypothetical protein
MLPVNLHHSREAGFFLSRSNHHGLLVMINPPSDGFFRWVVGWDHDSAAIDGFKNRVFESVLAFVVEEQADKVEIDGTPKFAGELAEQFFGVAMSGDGMRNSEQRFVALD